MRKLPSLIAALSAGAVVAGCNLIFGIQPAASTTGDATGSGATGGSMSSATGVLPGGAAGAAGAMGGSAGAAGAGATAGSGGAPDCPPEKVPDCHPMGGGGAVCDPIQLSEKDTGYTIGLAM